jgi:hypothetical protein
LRSSSEDLRKATVDNEEKAPRSMFFCLLGDGVRDLSLDIYAQILLQLIFLLEIMEESQSYSEFMELTRDLHSETAQSQIQSVSGDNVNYSSSNEISKLMEDRGKAKQFIMSCKKIIKKQAEQLKKNQQEYKKLISTLETQSFTSRFHAVAFKLELEALKIIGVLRKK